MPSSSAARMMSVPFGTLTWKPSMVRVTRSTGVWAGVVAWTVMAPPSSAP
ncbi:hypothetical protein ACFQX6_38370 [Streptosporangium lutulentum]